MASRVEESMAGKYERMLDSRYRWRACNPWQRINYPLGDSARVFVSKRVLIGGDKRDTGDIYLRPFLVLSHT